MKTRGYQLFIQILLVIVITAIVTMTCINLADLMEEFTRAMGNALTRFRWGF